MIDKRILEIAMEQSAIDASCQASDFTRLDNVIVKSKSSLKARKYLQLPFICNLISYGTNIVASIDMQYRDIVEKYINKYSVAQCFETPSMQVITMWQIGVDVIPEMRQQGIASALTSKLAIEILNYDKVPFYCCAWSNIKSVRNAIKSGFRPAWVEMTIKPDMFVNKLNN